MEMGLERALARKRSMEPPTAMDEAWLGIWAWMVLEIPATILGTILLPV